jgi:flagellin
MNSVNTNVGAMIALQNLNKTNSNLMEVQNRINTGLKVATAKDDGGIYAIAQRMRGDVRAYDAVSSSIDRAQSTVDVALAAGEAISDLLIDMKEKALAASDASLDADSRAALNEDFTALRDQITTIVDNATFNDVNLIDGSTAQITALANADGSNTLDVSAEVMGLGTTGSVLAITGGTAVDTATNAGTALTNIETSINQLNSALARLGTGSKSLEIQNTFIGKIQDATEAGIGNLVDADMARESSRLQALQVQQQLGVQALSIANSSPSTILGFFR